MSARLRRREPRYRLAWFLVTLASKIPGWEMSRRMSMASGPTTRVSCTGMAQRYSRSSIATARSNWAVLTCKMRIRRIARSSSTSGTMTRSKGMEGALSVKTANPTVCSQIRVDRCNGSFL